MDFPIKIMGLKPVKIFPSSNPLRHPTGPPEITRVPSVTEVTWEQFQESTRARTEQDRFAAMTQDRSRHGGWRAAGDTVGMAKISC